MRFFIVGGSGYVGRHLVSRLVAEGHETVCLARSDTASAAVRSAGGLPLLATLDDDTILQAETLAAEVIIYVAQFPSVAEETAAVRAGLARCRGHDKTFIMTSGTGVLCRDAGGIWSPHVYSEDDPFEPHPLLKDRVALEWEVRRASDAVGRTIVIRPPQVYGHGESVALPGMIARARELGFVPYIGAGLAIWSTVHVDDLVDLYIRATAAGTGGALYHAVGGEHCERHLAIEIALAMGIPARSISAEDLDGPYQSLAGCSSRSRAFRSCEELGWTPRAIDLFSDLTLGSYADELRRAVSTGSA